MKKNENYESSKSVKSAEIDKSKISKDFNQDNFIQGNKNIKKRKKI